MKQQALFVFIITLIVSIAAHSNEQKLLAQVSKIYTNYTNAHPECGYQDPPNIYVYSQAKYTLTNPVLKYEYKQQPGFKFNVRNIVIDGPGSNLPQCGKITIKCAIEQQASAHTNYYCERIHNGDSSDPALLADPQYDKYLAYQTIYNHTVMPIAKKNFGRLKQLSALVAFPPYSSDQMPDPSYEFIALAYTASPSLYPNPELPPAHNIPNYNNANFDKLFFGAAENIISVCKTLQRENISIEDAGVRFNEFLGLPPDSPDVKRKFIVFKLRNNPHISGKVDGNLFRPCPSDGNLYSPTCSGSAVIIPHNCNAPPPAPYDGTTIKSFLENQFYTAYCNNMPNPESGAVVYYPWTGQGFTYDWSPWNRQTKNVQGAAEYVAAINNSSAAISANSDNMQVIQQQTLEEFLATCSVGFD